MDELAKQILESYHNCLCNMSAARMSQDWELLEEAYKTSQEELERLGVPKFNGYPRMHFNYKEDYVPYSN